MRLYIACGLTHVPRDRFDGYVHFIHELARALALAGHDIRYALRDSDPQLATKPFGERARLCYLWDREMVEWADAVVAEASFPSTGLGIELQIAEAKGSPIILCFERSALNQATPVEYDNNGHTHHSLQIGEGFVSLMALGLPTVFRVISYIDHAIGVTEIIDTVELLDESSAAIL
jgi:hypothetical protein